MSHKLPIDPMGDARWARIERSLFKKVREGAAAPGTAPGSARVASRARLLRAMTVAAAVVGSGAAAAALVIAVRPDARTAAPAPTSRIVTEASASHVVFGEAALDVAPASIVEVEDEARRTVVRLERGEIALRVAPRPADRPLVVEAGDVRIRVVGTEFSVKREGEGASVRVVHGVIEVRAHGERAEVTAGGRWPARRAADGAADPAPTSEATPPVVTFVPAVPAVPVVPGGARGADTQGRGTREGSLRPAGGSGAASAQAQFEAAASLEKRDPEAALGRYAALARGSDGWAANALYAAGRLEADRHERGDAQRLLAEYLRRFPDGPNAQDARALLEALR